MTVGKVLLVGSAQVGKSSLRNCLFGLQDQQYIRTPMIKGTLNGLEIQIRRACFIRNITQNNLTDFHAILYLVDLQLDDLIIVDQLKLFFTELNNSLKKAKTTNHIACIVVGTKTDLCPNPGNQKERLDDLVQQAKIIINYESTIQTSAVSINKHSEIDDLRNTLSDETKAMIEQRTRRSQHALRLLHGSKRNSETASSLLSKPNSEKSEDKKTCIIL